MKVTLVQDDGPDITIDMEQVCVLRAIQLVHEVMTWHPNACGCCVTAHTPEGSYLIDEAGVFDFFPGMDVIPRDDENGDDAA